jgi:hypothetical protein
MKKALIPALIVFSAAFAPCLRNAVEFPDRTSEIARTVASLVFWHLSDELLDRGLARGTQTASHDGEEPEWEPVLHNDALVCLFFQLFLKHPFAGSLSAAGKKDALAVSIPQSIVRRTIEREFTPVHEPRQ